MTDNDEEGTSGFKPITVLAVFLVGAKVAGDAVSYLRADDDKTALGTLLATGFLLVYALAVLQETTRFIRKRRDRPER